MYFASRLQAGRMLASQLKPTYRYENCAVVALDDGGVIVGAQIARELHCIVMLLVNEGIDLPGEEHRSGGITDAGEFLYGDSFSSEESDEMAREYRTVIEGEKLAQLRKMSELLGAGGLMRGDLLKGHNVIVVADGLKNSFRLDIALEFLKPLGVERVVVATPLASLQAVNRVHAAADQIYCLTVVEDYTETEHYYAKHDIPDHETIVKTIRDIVLHWK